MAQILISFVILTSFSLHFFVAMDILWRKLAPRISTDKHNVTEIFFRGGAVITLGGIAAAVPKLDPFIGLVGAIFFSSLGEDQFLVNTFFFWKKTHLQNYHFGYFDPISIPNHSY